MRIDNALAWAKQQLITSESPLLDAQVLLAHTLEKETIYLMTWPERELSTVQQSAFEQLIEQRMSGIPVAHLTGTREFWSLPLKVNDSTLIPRPDSEVLVEQALLVATPQCTILDLGTGTGAILLALASELPQAVCLGVDFSDAAVQLSRENGHHLALNNCRFKQSDWFKNVTEKFDLIVSNPPYIDENDQHLAQGDLRFEPLSALVAKEKGLADIRLIAKQATNHLNDNGYLLFEHGFEQGAQVKEILNQYGYCEIKTIKDYGDNDRVTIGLWRTP